MSVDLIWPDDDNEETKGDDTNRLHDIRVQEVSLVDRPANKRRFLVLKARKSMAKTGAEVVDDGTGNLTSKGDGTMDLGAFDDETPGPGDEDIGGVDPNKSQDKDDDDDGDGDADASGDDKDDDGGDDDKGATDAEKGTNKILAALKQLGARIDKLEGKSKKADDKGGKAPAKKDEGDKSGDSDDKSGDSSEDSKIDKLVSAVGDLVTTTKAQHKELAELRKGRGASNALDLDPTGEGGGDEPITDWDDLNRHRREDARS